MFGKPISPGIPGSQSNGLTVQNKTTSFESPANYAGGTHRKNITHSGNTRMGNKKYNRKMGSFPDGNLSPSQPYPLMLNLSTAASRSVCHPSPVVRGGGYAGRAGWFRSWAAVLLVSI
jgi:hypothetical protein